MRHARTRTLSRRAELTCRMRRVRRCCRRRWCPAAAPAAARAAAGDRPDERRRRADGARARSRPPDRSPASTASASGSRGRRARPTRRNPSDNSLAVGPDHIVQTVNSRHGDLHEEGQAVRHDRARCSTARCDTNNVFTGFGGACEARNNGDAVVRYDQLADRWLIVMPIFRRAAARPDQPPAGKPASRRYVEPAGRRRAARRRGAAARIQPPPPPPAGTRPPPAAAPAAAQRAAAGRRARTRCATRSAPAPIRSARTIATSSCARCSPTTRVRRSGPTATTCRRAPATTSIQKHACVVDRAKMLKGEPATEQCVVIDGVNFLNNADLDGKALPPAGAPNIMMAAGGTQLKKIFEDDGIYAWKFHVDWNDPSKTKLDGPAEDRRRAVSLSVRRPADQLRAAAGHRAPARRAGRQDHGAARLPPRSATRVDRRGASVNTAAGGGGVRWYEFRRRQATRNVDAASAGHLRAGRLLPLDGEPGDRHAAATSASAIRSAARRTSPASGSPAGSPDDPPGVADAARDGARRGRGGADEHAALGGLHADRDRSERRLHDLVRRRLPARRTRPNYSTRIGAFRMPGCK